MHTITIYTKDNYNFYAEKYTDSELLLRHLNHGERHLYGEDHYKDIVKLATAHGWAINLVVEKNG